MSFAMARRSALEFDETSVISLLSDLEVGMAVARRDFDTAERLAEHALEEQRATADRLKEAAALHTVARVHLGKGQLEDALTVANEALNIFQEAEVLESEAAVMITLSKIYSMKADPRGPERAASEAQFKRKALREAKAAANMLKGVADMTGHASALLLSAEVYGNMGAFRDVAPLALTAAKLFQQVGDPRKEGVARFLAASAFASERQFPRPDDGRLEIAKTQLGDALELFKKTDDVRGQLAAQALSAAFALDENKHTEAVTGAQAAAAGYRRLEDKSEEAAALQTVANGCLHNLYARIDSMNVGGLSVPSVRAEDFTAGVQAAEESLSLINGIMDKKALPGALTTLAKLLYLRGDAFTASNAARDAVDQFSDLRDEKGEASALIILAQARFDSGSHEEGLKHAERSRTLFKQNSDPGGEGSVGELAKRLTAEMMKLGYFKKKTMQGAEAQKQKAKAKPKGPATDSLDKSDNDVRIDGKQFFLFEKFASRETRGAGLGDAGSSLASNVSGFSGVSGASKKVTQASDWNYPPPPRPISETMYEW